MVGAYQPIDSNTSYNAKLDMTAYRFDSSSLAEEFKKRLKQYWLLDAVVDSFNQVLVSPPDQFYYWAGIGKEANSIRSGR